MVDNFDFKNEKTKIVDAPDLRSRKKYIYYSNVPSENRIHIEKYPLTVMAHLSVDDNKNKSKFTIRQMHTCVEVAGYQ